MYMHNNNMYMCMCKPSFPTVPAVYPAYLSLGALSHQVD